MIMRLFKRRHSTNSRIFPVLMIVKNAIDKKLRLLASWLSRRAERQNVEAKRWILIVFSIVFSAGCIYSIVDAVIGSRKMVTFFQVSVPKHVMVSDSSESSSSRLLLTNREYLRLKSFVAQLDSMRQTKLGSATYDSLNQVRPGFVDSIGFVITVYEEQIKIK